MTTTFETMGNATVAVYKDGRGVIATDPWLVGTAYFGSWTLERPLNDRQMKAMLGMPYLWFSHGHPDHFHTESIDLIPKDKTLLLSESYHNDMKEYLEYVGHKVRVLKYREWFDLGDGIRICSMNNLNQDSILVIETPDGLIINKNDSPFMGEFRFLCSLVKKWPREKTWLTSLCAIDADMKNFVDASGKRIPLDPAPLKKGMIYKTARYSDGLGVGHFCCSSSQHAYVRNDASWAKEYLVKWSDIQSMWIRPAVKIHQPFVTVDMATGVVTPTPFNKETDDKRTYDPTGGDDWNTKLTEEQWQEATAFFQKYESLEDIVDFIGLTIGGERRDIRTSKRSVPKDQMRGIHFRVPAQSFLECIKWGYFDDLLIGNFMKTELINAQLYPEFTPNLAKYGGNAHAYTKKAVKELKSYYMRRNIWAYIPWRLSELMRWKILPFARRIADVTGTKTVMKYVYRRSIGDSV